MNKWLITIPSWGKRCNDALYRYAFPAIEAALNTRVYNRQVSFMIHTDEPEFMKRLFWQYDVKTRPVPIDPMHPKSPHHSLGLAHKEAIALAEHGSRIAFLCADMVPSVEVFDAADKRFAQDKKLIMCAATRTLSGSPPIGAKSQTLIDWTMRNMHPMIRECFFGTGRISCPWAIYFKRGDQIVLHGLHLHPFAAIKTNKMMSFQGATVDFDLAASFDYSEIHLVTDPNELSFAELSPAERVFPLHAKPFTMFDVVVWANARAHCIPVHHWFFEQRILIQGDGSNMDEMAIVDNILEALKGFD